MTPMLTKRSRRRPRASQFDPSYWEDALAVTRGNWEGRAEASARFAGDPVRGTRAARDAWRAGETYATVQYSAGVDLGDIRRTISGAAEAFTVWTNRAIDLQGAPPRLQDGSDYYFDVLRLVGLTMGCEDESTQERLLIAVAKQGADQVFARLGAPHAPDEASGTTPRPAREILAALDPGEDPVRHLQTHLDEWASRLKMMPWMGSLERTRRGDVAFIGYWAFEIIGVARSRGVKAADLRSETLPLELLPAG